MEGETQRTSTVERHRRKDGGKETEGNMTMNMYMNMKMNIK